MASCLAARTPKIIKIIEDQEQRAAPLLCLGRRPLA